MSECKTSIVVDFQPVKIIPSTTVSILETKNMRTLVLKQHANANAGLASALHGRRVARWRFRFVRGASNGGRETKMNPHRGDKSNELLAWMQIWDALRHLTPSDAAVDQMVRGPPGAPAQPGAARIRAEKKHQRDSRVSVEGFG